MISIGRSLRWYNKYEDEIDFSVKNHFDFMQIWFKDGKIVVDNVPEPKERFIKQAGFPIILHALFDLQDFEGRIILEVIDSDEEIVLSKQIINDAIRATC